MKKILSIIFLFALLTSGCNQDELLQQASSPNSLKFTASFEQNESRTYIDTSNNLHWSADDKISVFYGNTLNQQYKFDGATGKTEGTFSPIETTSNTTGSSLTKNYALYPYAADVEISESGVITATLPATQRYVENSFGLGANTMLAATQNTDDTFLEFKNVGGYLKLQLYGDDVTVKSITLTGNNNEKLAGKATITHSTTPTINMADDATESITLNCGDNGVKIGTTAETATAFWIVVPPTTFNNGFEISITDINGDIFKKSTSKSVLIERSIIKPMEAVKVNMNALELPKGSIFNSTVGTYLQNNTSLKKIKFVANSQTTSEAVLDTDTKGNVGYLVANGEWLEIHTSANNFRANVDCSNMFAYYDSNNNYTYLEQIEEVNFGDCFNTSKTTNMSYMFDGCSSLTSLDVSSFNTANVTDMAGMFHGCSSLTSLNVRNFSTSNVVNMKSMFDGCSLLTSLDVSQFNTAKVTNMESMFDGCSALSFIDLSNFKTEQVTNMGYMFLNCTSLTSLDVSKFCTSNVKNMIGMFYNCSSLVQLNVSNFNTEKATTLNNLFRGCSNLTTIDVSQFNTTNVTDMSYMFYGCSKLKTIDVSRFNTSNLKSMSAMFGKCTSLANLNLLTFTFNEYPSVTGMLELIGSTAESYPIPVKVTKEGYIYFTQINASSKIDERYAKFVNEDGSDCNYEVDPRIYNSQTTAVQPTSDDNGIYLIENAANLKWFMEHGGETAYNEANYKLTTDIISSSIYWDPIWFGGIFDGGNHYIENLKYDGYEDLAYGFFSNMYGTVKNLILKNPQISQSGDNDGYGMNSGLLAATASGSIINCGIIGGSVSISSTSKAWANGAGLVGKLNDGAVIKGCYVIEAKIKGSHTRNGTYVGGLVGECSGTNTITSCYTKDIDVSGNEGCNIGAFIGHAKSSVITLNTCYYNNSGDAIGSSYSTGTITTNVFEVLTESNFTQAITQMNNNLTDCDYIFGEDGSFVKRQ